MKTRSQYHETLTSYVHDVGIPYGIYSYGGLEFIQGEMRKKTKKYEIHTT